MSRPPRFFISPEQVTGSSISITGGDIRHIATVLRMRAGDELLLCDGQGTEFTVRIAGIDRAEIRTQILHEAKRSIPSPRIILAQGLPKSDKMDFIMQKATELGVATIVPVITERTIVKIKDAEKRTGRWRRICREAAMQSSRQDIPPVEPIQQYSGFLKSAAAHREQSVLLLPWEEGGQPIRNILRQYDSVKQVVVLIGPEGGFSAQEADRAREAGFHPVSLGPNILRTETAAVAVLAMIGYEYFEAGNRMPGSR